MPPIDSTKIIVKQIADIQHQLDSLGIEVAQQKIARDFFSDIIQSQMAWFGLFLAGAFGVIGLVYWRSIRKSIDNVSENLTNERENFNQQIKLLDEKINSAYSVNADMVKREFESLSIKLAKENDERNQKFNEDFKIARRRLLTRMRKIEFDARRAMYFYNIDKIAFLAALGWLVTMLRLVIVEKVPESKDVWIAELELFLLAERQFTPVITEDKENLTRYIEILDETLKSETDVGYNKRLYSFISSIKVKYNLK